MLNKKESAKQVMSLMDLTSLNDSDTEADIISLCEKSANDFSQVAAICIYPQFIEAAVHRLNKLGLKDVKVATVTNFPDGESDPEIVYQQTQSAVNSGAHEIDVVIPYRSVIKGDLVLARELVEATKQACGKKSLLKVIIESGVLETEKLIRTASEISIDAGADFIKTSTGKVSVNATLEATKWMLTSIKESGKDVGFKAAGGIRTVDDAESYLQLAAQIMGDDWINSKHFRFGASGLLADIESILTGKVKSQSQGY